MDNQAEIPFALEHVSGDYHLMMRWDSWYPVRKTPQGTLAFLQGFGDCHDGSEASAARIVAARMQSRY